MAFSSTLYPGEMVIDDSVGLVPVPEGQGRGLELGRRTTPYGQMRFAAPFPRELEIPESEWEGRIQEMEERKSRTSDICFQAGLPCKDQDGTNYCWANAPVYCAEVLRVVQNQEMVILSPASVAAPIKNFTNSGGWGEEALRFLVEHGCAPVEIWPANAINRGYLTTNARLVAQYYRVTEWNELVPRNMSQLISCLLRRIPVAVGYNWWGHEVTAVDAVWKNGRVAIRIRNSWGMGWGYQGYGILEGSKMPADDAVIPRVMIASAKVLQADPGAAVAV